MATFHSFSKLPAELRLQIWEASVRPLQPDLVAMHYCSMTSWAKEYTKPKYSIPGIDYHDVKNWSAYMWDFGLWTACWESRQVIIKAFKMRSWEGRVRQLESMAARCEKLWESEEGDQCLPLLQRVTPHPAGPGATDDPFHLMVQPFEDICCLDIDIYGFDSRKIFGRMMADFSDMFLDFSCPFTDLVLIHTPKALVFEFDPSWNFHFPDSRVALMNEFSPRELISKLVCDFRGYNGQAPYIWLLDRCDRRDQMLPESSSCKSSQQVFYDCDHEFVDIGLDYRSKDGCETASSFIKMLAGACAWEEESLPGEDGHSEDPRPEMNNYIGVLGYR